MESNQAYSKTSPLTPQTGIGVTTTPGITMLRLHKPKPLLLLCSLQSLVIDSIAHRKKLNSRLLSILCLLYGLVAVHLQKINMLYSINSSARKGKRLRARKEEDFLIAFAGLSLSVDLSPLRAISYLLKQAIEYLSLWLLSASSFYPWRRGYEVARTTGEVKKRLFLRRGPALIELRFS